MYVLHAEEAEDLVDVLPGVADNQFRIMQYRLNYDYIITIIIIISFIIIIIRSTSLLTLRGWGWGSWGGSYSIGEPCRRPPFSFSRLL